MGLVNCVYQNNYYICTVRTVKMKLLKIIPSPALPAFLIRTTDEPLLAVGSFKMENQEEVWKDIEELNKLYQISNFGRIKRKQRKTTASFVNERFSNPQDNGKGYLQLYVQINRIRTMLYVHRLVGIYFIPNPLSLPTINHKDGNKKNNHFTNLEWLSLGDNVRHAFSLGLVPSQKGKRSGKENYASIPVLAFKNEIFIKEFESMSLAGSEFGLDHSSVRSVCLGKSKQTKEGYTFKLKE